MADTWSRASTSKLDDTCQEIMEDIDSLEVKYKLRENWMEEQSLIEKPFLSDVSTVLTAAATTKD